MLAATLGDFEGCNEIAMTLIESGANIHALSEYN